MHRTKLKTYLKERGISYQAAADKLGTSYKWFANFVAGHTDASFRRCQKIINFFPGLTYEDLQPVDRPAKSQEGHQIQPRP